MKLIIKHKKVNNSKRTTKPMANQKSKPKRRPKSNAKVFGGKVLNFEVPLISKVFKNKIVQQVMASRGAVATIDDIALLVNNPQINAIQSNQFVRIAESGAAGGTIGALASLFRQGGLGILTNLTGGKTASQTVSNGGFA